MRNTIDYGVSVFQDVLAPIPVVRIVGDQVELLWDNLVQPISDSVVFGAIDPILNAPLNINSYINGVYNVGATTVNSLINTGFAEANYFLGGLPFAASTQESQLNRTAEVSTVPSTVKNSLAPAEQGRRTPRPAGRSRQDGAKRPNRDPHRLHRTRTTDTKQVSGADAGGNTVVRTQGEARGPLAKAISDVTKACGPGKPDKVGNRGRERTTVDREELERYGEESREGRSGGGEGRTRCGQGPTGRRGRRVTARASGCAGRAVAPAAARRQRSTAAIAIAR